MKKPAFLAQPMMQRVMYALLPVTAVSVYFFGWRVIALIAASCLSAFLAEWAMLPPKPGKVSQAVWVTGMIYGLSLPPTTPFWIAVVGAVIAIIFGKMTFGGFGKNIFNPAVVGRAFVFVCFPTELTGRFVPVFRGFPGGFAQWSFASLKQAPAWLSEAGLTMPDAITAATPMWALRDFKVSTSLMDLATGSIGGVFTDAGTPNVMAAGSTGEVCAIAIIVGALYLLITKTAQYRLMLGTILGAVAINLLLRNALGIHAVPPLAVTLLSGGLLYAAAFMVTDPISAPRQALSMWIYAFFIGAMIVVFRFKAVFSGGVGFAILVGNMLGPSIDLWLKRYQEKRKAAGK